MNKRTLITIIPAATLLLLAACTQDEPGGQGNELPYGEYPLQIGGVTLDVESSAEPWSAEGPQTRVTEDNTDGKSSVWQWDGSEMIGVRLGNETATYTLNAGPSLAPDRQLYWTSTAPATVTAWYPANETVDLSDQSNGLVYVLKATAENATYNNEITLGFKHQLAKVRVVPGTIDLANFIRMNGHAVVEKDNLTDVTEVLESAKMYTINLTAGEPVTKITEDNCNNISGSDNYVVNGTFNRQITVTGDSQDDQLTVRGNNGGSGIGGYVISSNNGASCGNIAIENATVHAYGVLFDPI